PLPSALTMRFSFTASPRALPSFPTRRSSDLDSARAMEKLGTAMPAQNLYEQVLLSDSMYWLLPRRPAQFALLVVTLLASALLLTDRKSTRLNSSHVSISYAVFCLKKNS